MVYKANDNLYSEIWEEKNLKPDSLVISVEIACQKLLETLLIDWQNDPNTKDTPKRMARMLIHEALQGKYTPCPKIVTFPNQGKLDQLYIVGPTTVRSMCSHHMVPIIGQAWLGILPGEEGRLLGLSKFSRLVDWIFRRPQIQEEATIQLADLIDDLIQPAGLAITVRAKHMCTSWRGVEDLDTTMLTSVTRGVLRECDAPRNEYLTLIKGCGF